MNLRRIYDSFGIALSIAILTAFFYGNGERIWNADSPAYVDFADSVISGELFVRKDLSEIDWARLSKRDWDRDWARAARTPGYPILIVAAKLLFDDFIEGIFFFHLLIAALVIIFVSLVLRPWVPTIVTGLTIVGAEIWWRDYYYLVLTEWLAIHMLIALIGLLVIVLRTPDNRNIAILTLFAAILVLVRPATLPVFALLPLVLLYRRRVDIAGVLMIAAALMPLLLWMGFNKVYLGSFSITAISGHSWLGVASLIGHAEAEPGDSANLATFIEKFNARKVPAVNDDEQNIESGKAWEFQPQYNYNIYATARPIVQRMQMDVVTYDREIFTPYGKRVILAHPDRYARYIWYTFEAGLAHLFPLYVGLLVIPLLCINRKKSQMLASIAITFLGLHLLHLLLIAMVVAIYYRYLDFTLFPYVTAVALAGWGLLFAELADTRFIVTAPNWIKVFFPASAMSKN